MLFQTCYILLLYIIFSQSILQSVEICVNVVHISQSMSNTCRMLFWCSLNFPINTVMQWYMSVLLPLNPWALIWCNRFVETWSWSVGICWFWLQVLHAYNRLHLCNTFSCDHLCTVGAFHIVSFFLQLKVVMGGNIALAAFSRSLPPWWNCISNEIDG